MEKNKTGRYFKYAIGEIFLVMVGILLALQVNNWNQNRQLAKEEFKVLKSLHQEFSENRVRFNDIYDLQLYRKKCINAVMSNNFKELTFDNLGTLMGGVTQQWTYDPFLSIYKSVINSGKIELITNDVLKKELSEFQDLLKDYKEEELNANEFAANNLYPFIIDNFKMDFNLIFNNIEITEEEKTIYKSDIIKLYESDKFENLMVYVYSYMRDIFTEGPMLREKMISIINLLELEIEKHE
ncbi:DUF6090 family protein [Xanthomarina sp. GH4-25]|uniref:DUF6090 family protein n=1 Tax=Xanthomarina sp. GH4-25 TaxID=3349335 RepID=UPI000D675A4D|nr:hypothetical protein DI383_08945 [Flavobacteriaceae bacterium LYZ1037]